MAPITRPGSHGTPMKPYGSFAGKTQEGGSAIMIMLATHHYNGGMTTGKKKAK